MGLTDCVSLIALRLFSNLLLSFPAANAANYPADEKAEEQYDDEENGSWERDGPCDECYVNGLGILNDEDQRDNSGDCAYNKFSHGGLLSLGNYDNYDGS